MRNPSENENQSLAVEVANLPLESPTFPSTGFLERTHNRRYAAHHALLQTLQTDIRAISKTTDQFFLSRLASLREFLDSSTKELSDIVSHVDPTKLAPSEISLSQFRNAESENACQAAARREEIERAMRETECAESQRITQVLGVFNSIQSQMTAKSHLKPGDVAQIMQHEAMIVNDILQKNGKVYVDLFHRLLKESAYNEQRYLAVLYQSEKEWKQAVLLHYVEDGLHSLEQTVNKVIVTPGILSNFTKRLHAHQDQIRQLFDEVGIFTPPTLTTKKVREWLKVTVGALDIFYDEYLQGIDAFRKQCDDAATRVTRSLFKRAKLLPESLSLSPDDIRRKLTDVYLHRSAAFLSRINNDLQFYIHHILQAKDQQVSMLHGLFSFIHGTAWHWELHCNGAAKAEDLLDAQLQKQRVALNVVIETKINPKVKTTLDSLRLVNAMTAIGGLLNALQTSSNELEKAVNETAKKMQKFIGGYQTIMAILLRGYQKRLYSYLQVNPVQSTNTEPSNEPSSETLIKDPLSELGSGNRRLPDIPVSANERRLLKELGLALSDEENLGLRLKLVPPYQDDPRASPPLSEIVTPKGAIFSPLPVPLQQSQRFPKEKDLGKKEQEPRMTESQMEIDNIEYEPPVHSGLINLDEYVENLPKENSILEFFTGFLDNFRKTLLAHVKDIWEDEFMQRSSALLDSKRELCETEMQMRTFSFSSKLAMLQHGIIAAREKELNDHDAAYKARENELGKATVWTKEEIIKTSSDVGEKTAPAKDRMGVLEKAFYSASRIGQVNQIQNQIKDDMVPFFTIVTSLYNALRSRISERIQTLTADCKEATSKIQKFPDGSYTPEEHKQYTQLYQKLIEKCTATEKSLLDEIKNAETKRRQLLEGFMTKALESVPQHQADVTLVTVLAERLEKAQAMIKAQAAAVNTAFGSCQNGYAGLHKAMETSGKMPEGDVLQHFQRMLEDFKVAATTLGCLRPDLPIPLPPPLPPPEPAKSPVPSSKTTKASKRKSSPVPLLPVPPPHPPIPPTDFQLSTVDGPLHPVATGILILPDVKKPAKTDPTSGSEAKKGRGSIGPRASIAGKNKNLKKLEKFLVFGESPVERPVEFLENVNKECWMALNDVLTAVEEYYRLKGNKPVTRPMIIPPTVEILAERLCKKLLNYQTQSENFAHFVMEKLRSLSEEIIKMVPGLMLAVLKDIYTPYRLEMLIVQRKMVEEFGVNRQAVEDCRKDVEKLGFPEEVVRNNDVPGMLKILSTQAKKSWEETFQKVTEELLTKFLLSSAAFFLECDNIIPSYEIKRPLVPNTTIARPPSPPLSSSIDTGSKTWKALDLQDLSVNVATSDIQCGKTTVAHVEVNEVRHRVFKEFLGFYQELSTQGGRFNVSSVDQGKLAEKVEFQQLQLKKLEALGLMRTI